MIRLGWSIQMLRVFFILIEFVVELFCTSINVPQFWFALPNLMCARSSDGSVWLIKPFDRFPCKETCSFYRQNSSEFGFGKKILSFSEPGELRSKLWQRFFFVNESQNCWVGRTICCITDLQNYCHLSYECHPFHSQTIFILAPVNKFSVFFQDLCFVGLGSSFPFEDGEYSYSQKNSLFFSSSTNTVFVVFLQYIIPNTGKQICCKMAHTYLECIKEV